MIFSILIALRIRLSKLDESFAPLFSCSRVELYLEHIFVIKYVFSCLTQCRMFIESNTHWLIMLRICLGIFIIVAMILTPELDRIRLNLRMWRIWRFFIAHGSLNWHQFLWRKLIIPLFRVFRLCGSSSQQENVQHYFLDCCLV